jgi:hypothetical protein
MDRIAQSAAQGAEPQLRAGTDPLARGGAFYGPKYYLRGRAVEISPPRAALDARARVRLWEACERLTGVAALSD